MESNINGNVSAANSNDGCAELFSLELDPVVISVTIVLYVATILVCLVLAREIYNNVDIGHPVFAVIFQEAVAIGISGLLVLGLFVARKLVEKGLKRGTFEYLGYLLATLTVQLHQSSWLCVTYLRYSLLIIKYLPLLEAYGKFFFLKGTTCWSYTVEMTMWTWAY